MRKVCIMLLIVQYSFAQFGGFGGLGGGLGSCCCCCCPCPCPPMPPPVYYVNPCPPATTSNPVGVPDVVVGPCVPTVNDISHLRRGGHSTVQSTSRSTSSLDILPISDVKLFVAGRLFRIDLPSTIEYYLLPPSCDICKLLIRTKSSSHA
ncbi:unnamed protein product [Cylicocyclus nassatus]|uniref:Uncharacterized protein n=1 Tax=Cylicocyclus nassatus TaxID=53992 RepID=A0AA36MB45_CYLNA|nr:unnamed protein product [Cylicocyclus nassatus]